MRKTSLFICLLLIGNLACTQPQVFFENFNIGDKLEKCLANGLIQSSGGPHAGTPFEWELTDSNIKTYFQRTGVVFDNNNNIKEIELLASNYTNQNQRENVDVRNSFNYMLKYFSQRYSGMKKGEFNTKDDTSCLYEVGTEYVWNTPYLTIRVQLFNTVHNAIAHANKKSQLGDFCMDEWMRSGSFARVKIIKK